MTINGEEVKTDEDMQRALSAWNKMLDNPRLKEWNIDIENNDIPGLRTYTRIGFDSRQDMMIFLKKFVEEAA